MSRQKDRDEFIALMTQEGVPLDVTRALMRAGTSLHRIAELQCSSEAADRDRVKCPGDSAPGVCLCRDYGSYCWDAHERAECGRCRRSWCASCDPGPSALCHWCHGRGRSTAPWRGGTCKGQHGTVPRINVQEARIEARVTKLCTLHNLVPVFNGDPRGAVLKIKVPSGRTNDWGREGVCVP